MQDTDTTFSPHAPAARADDLRLTPAVFPKERPHAADKTDAASRPGALKRFFSFIAGLFSFPLPGMRSASRREELLETVVKEKSASHHDVASVIFKGNTASTLVTPLGTYSGKSSSLDLRKLAEKQFHAMQSSEGATIN